MRDKEAEEAFLEARQIFESEKNETWVALVDLWRAQLLIRRQQFQAAQDLASKSAEVFKKQQIPVRAANARLVYVTPSHQFPLGYTMTLARRLELLNWSQRARAWILEDDYDGEYRYTSRPIPALQGLAAQEQVIYVGTFSKVLFPSLRLGYLVVPSALVDVFAAARTVAAGPPPLVEQAVLTEFITEGHFGRHIRRMRALYQERRAVLLDAAKHELSGLLEVQVSDTGLHAIGWLPQGIDDRSAARFAATEGVDTARLSSFYRGPSKRSGLMLGFAAFSEPELRSGARKLARALRAMK